MQGRLGREGVLVHRPGQVGVEQPLLHGLQVGLAAAEVLQTLLPHERLVLARLNQLGTEPLAGLVVLDPQRFEVGQDRRFQLVLAPADGRVVLVGIDVGTAVLSTELLDEINNLRESLREDNLPIDDDIEQMEVDATGYSHRVFVHQLRLIQISNARVVRAIRDYYRAFVQRSRWVREELVGVGDLDRYSARLKDAWQAHFLIMRDELGESAAEEEMRSAATNLYKWIETGELPRIRPQCQDGFVARGSFHILADDLKVGWHPEFEARLRHLLEPVAEEVRQ